MLVVKVLRMLVVKVLGVGKRPSIMDQRPEDVPLPHKNYPSTLTDLTINGFGLRGIDASIFRLQNLHTLNLSDNKIQSVEVLKQMSGQLGQLILANNEISEIPGDFFDAPVFQGLTYLDLSGNELVTLPRSISELVKLGTLNLAKNKLRCLPYDVHKLKDLRKLHLGENNLEFLPLTLGHWLPGLAELDLSNNPALFITQDELKIDSVEVLKQMSGRLGQLILANNEISEIPGDFFDAPVFQGLTYLDLSGNELVTLPRSISELVKLGTLNLAKNKLRCLPYDVHKLKDLRKLQLGENNLEFLPFTLGHWLPGLAELDLSNNPALFITQDELKIDSVGENQFPTLFELASSKIASLDYPFPSNFFKIQDLADEIPRVVLESVQACKFCALCLRMVSRYKIITRKSFQFVRLTQVIGLIGPMNKKIISCEKCFEEEWYEFV